MINLILIFLFCSSLAYATPKHCITSDYDDYAFEEFDNYDSAILFAKGMHMEENLIKNTDSSSGEITWRVFIGTLPINLRCAIIKEGI